MEPGYVLVLRQLVAELSESLPDGLNLLVSDPAYVQPRRVTDPNTGEKRLRAALNGRMQIVLAPYCADTTERCRLLDQLFDPIIPYQSSKEVTVAQAEAIWQMRDQFDLLMQQVRQPIEQPIPADRPF